MIGILCHDNLRAFKAGFSHQPINFSFWGGDKSLELLMPGADERHLLLSFPLSGRSAPTAFTLRTAGTHYHSPPSPCFSAPLCGPPIRTALIIITIVPECLQQLRSVGSAFVPLFSNMRWRTYINVVSKAADLSQTSALGDCTVVCKCVCVCVKPRLGRSPAGCDGLPRDRARRQQQQRWQRLRAHTHAHTQPNQNRPRVIFTCSSHMVQPSPLILLQFVVVV